MGFIGAILILSIYLVIIALGIKISLNASDRLGSYLASGITVVIAVQLLINIAVVTGVNIIYYIINLYLGNLNPKFFLFIG